ncbi:hypothetical protein [Azospirillum sp. TSO22-1]|uniref:hypothetical protein n=1 Tax=Azospirillum sp. TSO22-1 TaxID=716789 RepID=UPI0011B671E7|nr:hypothetical protein [Azospirillum sp. TSO22-1]
MPRGLSRSDLKQETRQFRLTEETGGGTATPAGSRGKLNVRRKKADCAFYAGDGQARGIKIVLQHHHAIEQLGALGHQGANQIRFVHLRSPGFAGYDILRKATPA